MNMVGQNKLMQKYNQLSLDCMPQSLLLIGEHGCGKHLFVKNVAEKLKLDLIVLDNKITQESINDISTKSSLAIYVIDIDSMLTKVQNTLLKLIEEPPQGSYFILMGESTGSILPTVLNRCVVWYFESYKKAELNQFINTDHPHKDILVDIFRTPGQILEYQEHPLEAAMQLAENMITRIGAASIANVLTISDKIGFKAEKDKIDLNLFIEVLTYSLIKEMRNCSLPYLINMYQELIGLKNNLKFSISKQRVFENFLIRFRGAMRDATT